MSFKNFSTAHPAAPNPNASDKPESAPKAAETPAPVEKTPIGDKPAAKQ